MAKRRQPTHVSVPLMVDALDLGAEARGRVDGAEGPGRRPPAPTRAAARSAYETNQRKPLVEPPCGDAPPLEDGVAFRQSMY